MDAFAQRAVEPPGSWAFGLRLHPVTLGHLFCLLRYVPAVVEGGRCGLRELLMAGFILSHRMSDDCEHSLRRRWLGLFFLLWGRVIRWRKMDLNVEATRLCAFIADSCSRAPYRTGGNTRTLGSHGLVASLALAMRELRLSESDALTMPLVRLNALVTAALEVDGRVELWNADDQSFWDFCRNRDLEAASRVRN
jgi:hypothetical protein